MSNPLDDIFGAPKAPATATHPLDDIFSAPDPTAGMTLEQRRAHNRQKIAAQNAAFAQSHPGGLPGSVADDPSFRNSTPMGELALMYPAIDEWAHMDPTEGMNLEDTLSGAVSGAMHEGVDLSSIPSYLTGTAVLDKLIGRDTNAYKKPIHEALSNEESLQPRGSGAAFDVGKVVGQFAAQAPVYSAVGPEAATDAIVSKFSPVIPALVRRLGKLGLNVTGDVVEGYLVEAAKNGELPDVGDAKSVGTNALFSLGTRVLLGKLMHGKEPNAEAAPHEAAPVAESAPQNAPEAPPVDAPVPVDAAPPGAPEAPVEPANVVDAADRFTEPEQPVLTEQAAPALRVGDDGYIAPPPTNASTVRDKLKEIIIKGKTATEEEKDFRAAHNLKSGLPNEDSYIRRLHEMQQTGNPVHVGSMDATNFKIYNTHGRANGDRAIAFIADALDPFLRESNVEVFHLGGDEFAFLSHDAEAMDNLVADFREATKGSRIKIEKADGTIEYEPFRGVQYGRGENFDAADAAQALDKKRLDAEGKRLERADIDAAIQRARGTDGLGPDRAGGQNHPGDAQPASGTGAASPPEPLQAGPVAEALPVEEPPIPDGGSGEGTPLNPDVPPPTPQEPPTAPSGAGKTGETSVASEFFEPIVHRLERSGEVGKKIARTLFYIHREASRRAGKPIHALAELKQLSKPELQGFIDVLNGTTDAANVPEGVRDMATQFRKFFNDVASRAEKAGVMVQDADGSYRRFQPRKDYLPQIFEKDANGQWQLRDSDPTLGQFTGNIMKARKGGGRELTPDELIHELDRYFRNSNRTIAEAKFMKTGENFSRDQIRERIQQWANEAAKKGEDAEYIANSLPAVFGETNHASTKAQKLIENVAAGETAAKLPLAVISNATQSAFTAAETGAPRVVKTAWDYAFGGKEMREEMRRVFVESGAGLDNLSRSLASSTSKSPMTRVASGVLKYTGFNAVEKFNRIIAANAGARYAESLANQVSSGKGIGSKFAARDLARVLGVSEEEAIAAAKRGLSDSEKADAGFFISEKTQFSAARESLPPTWIKSDWARLLAQFRSFSLRSGYYIADEMVRPLLTGSGQERAAALKKAANFAVVGVPLATLAEAVRNKITAKDTSEETAMDHVVNNITALFMMDQATRMYRDLRRGEAVHAFVPPVIGDVGSLTHLIISSSSKLVNGEGEELIHNIRHGKKEGRDIINLVPSVRAIINNTKDW